MSKTMSRRPLWTALLLCVVLFFLMEKGGLLREDPPPSWLEDGRKIVLEGRICRQERKENSILLYLNQVTVKSESDFKFSKYAVVSIKEKKEWSIGRVILVSGTVEELKEASNWGGFDQKTYYEQQGVGLSVRDAKVEEELRKASLYFTMLAKMRQSFRESIEQISSPKDGAVLKAMILGDKSDLDQEQKEIYQRGGISHILAISGLHISFLGMLLYQFLRKRGLPFAASGSIAAVVIGSYAVLTGMSVSAQRAVVMFFLYLGAEILGQTYDVLSALSFAGLILLAKQHQNLGQASFLLSFGAVLGLALLLPEMEEAFKREKERQAEKVMRASICVSLATLPISLWFFYEWSVVGIFLNLLVIPTVQIVLLSGIAGMAAGIFGEAIGTVVAAPAHYLLLLYENLANFAGNIPFGVWKAGRPERWQIVMYYVLLVLIVLTAHWSKKRWKKGVWVAGGILLFLAIGKLPDTRLLVTVLDVGQGDGICIQNGTKGCYLIDGGSTTSSELGRFCLEPYLKFEGISEIDGWFVTHTDLDHVSGLLEILQSYRRTWDGRNGEGVTIDRIFLPCREKKTEMYDLLEKLATENKIALYYMEKGKTIREGKMELECVAPDRAVLSGEENSDSMVLLLKYGEFQALFMGDLEREGEQKLLQSGLLQNVDFLKVAHHGSQFSTTEEFLRQTQPKLAVISCAENNRYGHPHTALLERLEKIHAIIKMTKESGGIKVASDGEHFGLEEYSVQRENKMDDEKEEKDEHS